MHQPNYIILQCYGYEAVFLECAYALMSLSRLYKPEDFTNTEICIYTDKPEWFDRFADCPLPLHFRKMDAALIKQWRGEIDFVHRIKIELLLDFTKNRTGNILYADTDMVFLQKLDDVWNGIAPGELYMHMQEGKISEKGNPLFRKLDTFLRSSKALKAEGTPLCDLYMWNAGILGFHTSHRELLQKALEYTDSEHPKFPKHIIEQFAFSIQFSSKGNIKSALPYALHYWNMKELRQIIASFLQYFDGKPWADLVRYSSLIQPYILVTEKNMFMQNRSVTEKLLNKKWVPLIPDWELLEKQI